ncbi:MAG: GGDEF domain-containing protein [Betaproteobacteria bacterium]|nr:GGDEF domain-containing protein [Betaproteobacteria bacterium]
MRRLGQDRPAARPSAPPLTEGPGRKGLLDDPHGVLTVNMAWAALAVHAVLGVFFLAAGAKTLVLFNAGSIALYFSLPPMVRRGWVTAALLLATAEVITHTALAVRFFGAQADFQYYIFALALLSFLHDGWAVGAKIGYLAFICAAYLALSEWSLTHAPATLLAPDLLRVVRSFNTVITFGFVAYLAHHHAVLADRAQTELGRLATSDALTGLYNRRGLLDRLDQELTKCERSGKPLSLLLADVDNFKRINDTFGHEYGDQALQAIANCLRATVRAQDLVARWGGEEFLLLMPDTPLEGARSLAEKLRQAVSSASLVHDGQRLTITFTAALMEFPAQGSFHHVLGRVDDALRAGKHAGKDRIMAIPA